MTCFAIARNVSRKCKANSKSNFGEVLERFCETSWKGVGEALHTKV